MKVYLDHLRETTDLTFLAEGKEGKVFRCAAPGVAVKVYAQPPSANKIDQIEQMAAMSMPPNRFAWPLGLVRSGAGGQPIGLAMPFVRGVSLYDAVFGRAAKGFCGLARIELAADLADLFDLAHNRHVIIGDVSDRNFLIPTDSAGAIDRPARGFGIDCDGFNVPGRDRQTGRPCRFGEPLGTPPHVPPELLSLSTLRGASRTQAHDLFGLASLLFAVLVGNYAHEVRDASGRAVTDLAALIRAGQFPYAPASPLPPGIVPKDRTGRWACFPCDVRDLFIRAFRDAHSNPAVRPTAAEWRAALRKWHAAKLAQVPTAGNAFLQYLHGRLGRRAFLQSLDKAATGFDLAPAWTWLRTGSRLKWAAAGVAGAVLVGAALLRSPVPRNPVAGAPATQFEGTSATDHPVRPTRKPLSETERRAAEERWKGAPPVILEALVESLEERP